MQSRAGDRTPSSRRAAAAGVWCFEREFEGQEKQPPVKLVVFDWDETLTLSTFVPADRHLRERIGWNEWAEYITLNNFETPFVTSGGTRVAKLQALFSKLRGGPSDAASRYLAILTRNNQGVIACLNLLMMANLSEHFSAIWCMANLSGIPSGVYQTPGGTWEPFNPPLKEVFDHKADVLHAMCKDPNAYFPGLVQDGHGPLEGIRPEQIVLVDDVRTNFQSLYPDNAKVLRYCKVARYDCHYRDLGFRNDMGGIGARSDSDYDKLLDFVQQPWQYKAVLKAQCTEHPLTDGEDRPRVDLVVFDFDETLTLHTWLAEGEPFCHEIDCGISAEDRRDLVLYNFESPYIEGDRVSKLAALFEEICNASSEDTNGDRRTLAILTRNEDGAIAVLNLLIFAGLDVHFAAVWVMDAGSKPGGAYRDGTSWTPFTLPIAADALEQMCKADVLKQVVRDPQAWFPQMNSESAAFEHLRGMSSLASVVLVDDEPRNFRDSPGDGAPTVLRCCEVTRYDDDNFRDQGLVTHMGGLGAKTDEDYRELLEFVRRPWLYRDVITSQDSDPLFFPKTLSEASVVLERRHTQDELDMEYSPTKERRRTRSLTLPGDMRGV